MTQESNPSEAITIVLVEDQSILLESLRAALSSTRFKLLGEAQDGETALELITELKPQIACVDLQIPKLSGIEVIRRVSDKLPSTRCVALSGHTGPDIVSESLRSGALGFVDKTAGLDELYQALEKAADGHSFLSDSATVALRRSVMGTNAPSLTNTELTVLRHIAEGLYSKEIADKLNMSPRTVESHRYNMMQKLGVKGVAQLTRVGIALGLVPPLDASSLPSTKGMASPLNPPNPPNPPNDSPPQ